MLQNPVNDLTINPINIELPFYDGVAWLPMGLPQQAAEWPVAVSEPSPLICGDECVPGCVASVVKRCSSQCPWQWPEQPIFFVADPHADAEAFVASLVASGGIRKTGPTPHDIELTQEGRKGIFVIGGDCLDKGPSNLDLLQSIRNLMDTGAQVKLLAGNHDVRLLMGIMALDLPRNAGTEHLFLRMGPKVVPLLREVFERYLADVETLSVPSRKECRRRLYPSDAWFREFPRLAAGLIPRRAITKELKRMRKKVEVFEDCCADAGMSLRQVYATAQQCRELFLQPEGEYGWFFERMQLAYRQGSFLFVHAGLDDQMVSLLTRYDEDHLNRLYRQQIQSDLFGFYYGPLANSMRTKYRDVDMPLTTDGVAAASRLGLHAVVHGHRNRTSGQSIALRQGMIHIEGDITLDRNSRRKEGLQGYGMGVTIIRPEGRVIGISNDYPFAKVFEPQRYL